MTAFGFTAERMAALRALSDRINGQHAPPPITDPVLVNDHGHVLLPVPGAHDAHVWAYLHLGLTLQWAPVAERGGLRIEFRGGSPDSELDRDSAAVFLTLRGLGDLIADLQAIRSQIGAGL